jgi:hypothetical protein
VTSIIERAVQQMRTQNSMSIRRRNYYNGFHDAAFSKRSTYTNEQRLMLENLKENLVRPCVDLVIDRMNVSGVASVGMESMYDDVLAARAYNIFLSNRGPLRVKDWMTSIEVVGDQYGVAIVWPDSTGKVRIWWQQPQNVAVQMSEEFPDQPLWVAKRWFDGSFSRLTMYDPFTVKEFKSTSPTLKDPDWSTYELESEIENPFGIVPAVAVTLNHALLNDIIPLNDALNRTLADMAITSSYVSQPMRVWMGLEVEIDPDTGLKKPPFEVGDSRTVFLPPAMAGEQQTSVVDLPGADPSPFIKQAEAFRTSIARLARIPARHLMNTMSVPPSGSSLRAAEQPFISRVKARQDVYSAALGDVLSLAVVMDAFLATGQFIDRPSLTVIFDDPAGDDINEMSQVAERLFNMGVPLGEVLTRYMRWDDDEASALVDGSLADDGEQMRTVFAESTEALPQQSAYALDFMSTGPNAVNKV